MPILVKQTGPIDLDPIDLCQLQAWPIGRRQHRDAVATLLQAFDGALQNDFRTAADIRCVKAADEQDFHSG
ncbi:Phosphoribosylaminoimidazole carboxylase [Pseudomonas syringae pv. actinidiae]|uniref:Phosphoribosylaminoimidazole carboxylase n=1 Tax=Pseudomonas syringae pv. actinidiae TaxID=103796 RepID=A0A2V0Q8V9_PSESF|nr:Phosphoribosylaminoimidazole carboxylase [Pseudomonas syringae pv. actinidiae]GBH17004.1 Phosphoribosylaminoimidazole carboxylase [Pseudomonas syringae pv. actinidiae]